MTCLRPLTPAWRRNVEDQTARLGLTWNQIPHQRDEPEPEPVWHVVPWSACTPVVRLYRPVTTNRSDACLIRINVLLSLPARRRGDISTPGRQNSPFFVLSLSLSFPARRKRQQETREEESVVTSELQQVRSGHGVSLRTCGPTSFSHRPVFRPPGPSRPPRRRAAGRSASSRVRSFHHAWFLHQDEHKTDFFPPPWFPHEHVTELRPIEDATQTDVSGGRRTGDTDA